MLVSVHLDHISDNPFQTRTAYDAAAIQELADDIAVHGLLQPPVGRRLADPQGSLKDGDVQLAFGHRRLRACRLLAARGFTAELEVDVRELDDQAMAELAWSENQQRRDITAIEQAEAIQRMMQTFGWNQETVAARLGIARSTVANKLRLLRLPAAQVEQLRRGELSERQAAALLPLYDLPAPLLKHLENQPWDQGKPSKILAAAPGESSDRLRASVERAIGSATLPLESAWAAHSFPDAPAHKLHSAACDACKQRLIVDAQARCLDRTCWQAKNALWQAHRLALAAQATGIPVAEVAVSGGGFRDLPAAEMQRIVAQPCKNLRLQYDTNSDYFAAHPQDFADVNIVCARGASCACVRKWREQQQNDGLSRDPDEAERKQAQKQAQAQLFPPASAVIGAALADANPRVWRALVYLVTGERPPAQADPVDCQGKVGAALLKRALGYQATTLADLAALRSAVEQALVDLDLATPWPLSDLERLRLRLSTLQAGLPKLLNGFSQERGDRAGELAARAGELAADLAHYVAAQRSAGDLLPDPTIDNDARAARQLAGAATRLAPLLATVQDTYWSGGYSALNLATTGIGSPLWERELPHADALVLRCALAISPGDDCARLAALEAALAALTADVPAAVAAAAIPAL